MEATKVLSIDGKARAVCSRHAREFRMCSPKYVGEPVTGEECEFCEANERQAAYLPRELRGFHTVDE